MKKNTIFLLIPLLLVFLMGQSCISLTSSKKETTLDAGVYKSLDRGQTWSHKVGIMTAGSALSFPNATINDFYIDPSDHNAVYAASSSNGIFYSYNAAEGWQQPPGVTSGNIRSIVIDPEDKCNIYYSSGNKIYVSTDCNRTYERIYQDTRSKATINTLVIDHYNSAIIYAGNYYGDILKSTDNGASWEVIHRFEEEVTQLLIDSNDSRILYAVELGKGIHKSINAGADWVDLSEGLKEFKSSRTGVTLIQDISQKNIFLHASKFGLLRSTNGCETWSEIPLLTPPASTDIKDVIVSPKNNNEIYYITTSTFYATNDGGKTWTTFDLPTSSDGNSLMIDPEKPEIIYLGVKAKEK